MFSDSNLSDSINKCCSFPGRLSYKTDGDARRKFRIKPLKETNLERGSSFNCPLSDATLGTNVTVQRLRPRPGRNKIIRIVSFLEQSQLEAARSLNVS